MVSSSRDRSKGPDFLPWHWLLQGRTNGLGGAGGWHFSRLFGKLILREALAGNCFSCLPPSALPLSRATTGCEFSPSQTCCAQTLLPFPVSRDSPHLPASPVPWARALAQHGSFTNTAFLTSAAQEKSLTQRPQYLRAFPEAFSCRWKGVGEVLRESNKLEKTSGTIEWNCDRTPPWHRVPRP